MHIYVDNVYAKFNKTQIILSMDSLANMTISIVIEILTMVCVVALTKEHVSADLAYVHAIQ